MVLSPEPLPTKSLRRLSGSHRMLTLYDSLFLLFLPFPPLSYTLAYVLLTLASLGLSFSPYFALSHSHSLSLSLSHLLTRTLAHSHSYPPTTPSFSYTFSSLFAPLTFFYIGFSQLVLGDESSCKARFISIFLGTGIDRDPSLGNYINFLHPHFNFSNISSLFQKADLRRLYSLRTRVYV